jgi:excisionase family DNA binding protein
MNDRAEPLTLHEAAARLDVHYMTVYRWVRLGILAAHKESGTWRIDPADLADVRVRASQATASAPSGPAPTGSKPRRAPWSARLRERMLAGDLSGSWSVVEAAMASGVTPEDVYVEMLAPALHAIGAGWERGAVPIEREHLASGVAAAIIGRMSARFRRRGRHRGAVVLAMPEGERHGLGVAMLADIVAQGGYEVLNLGPDTPPASLAATVGASDRIRAVVVSVVDRRNLAAAARLVSACRSVDDRIPIVAGGFAIPDPRTAQQIGATSWAADPRTLAKLIDELGAP